MRETVGAEGTEESSTKHREKRGDAEQRRQKNGGWTGSHRSSWTRMLADKGRGHGELWFAVGLG